MAYPVRVVLCLAVCAVALGAVPAVAMAGSISGTVTAESGGAPIGGVEVCPQRQPYTVETDCTVTDGSGNYSLSSLPEGSYMLYFSANPANLKYVSEFYDNKRYPWESDLVPIAWNQDRTGLNVQLAEGGSISGIVTEEGTGAPIAGIRACARDSQGLDDRCTNSGPTGAYRINGLRSDEYSVEFEGGNRVNYLREFYKDAANWAAAEKLTVEAPNLVPNIDDTLAPGAQILGHVSDVGNGGPAFDVTVCAEALVGEVEACDSTDAAGDYALRSLPAATYIVGFGIEYLPFGRWAQQWWQGATLKTEATPIELAPPESRGDINGQAKSPFGEWPQDAVAPPTPPAILPKANVRPPKCRKGFHRQQVRGISRCVRKHRKAHPHTSRGKAR
jgi:hypothetical protein